MKKTYIYGAVAIIVIFIVLMVAINQSSEVDTALDANSTTTPKVTTPTPRPSTGTSVTQPTVTPTTPSKTPVASTPLSITGLILRLDSYNGTEMPADSRYTVSFDGTALSAKFCNSLQGNYSLDKQTKVLTASNLVGTKMYCSSPTSLMPAETAFGSMVNFGATLVQQGNTLVMTDNKGSTFVFSGFQN